MSKIYAPEKFEKNPQFTTREQIAIGFAERMTITGMEVTDTEFAEAQKWFSLEELVELASIIALENFRSKFNHLFRIEAQGFCAINKKKPAGKNGGREKRL